MHPIAFSIVQLISIGMEFMACTLVSVSDCKPFLQEKGIAKSP